MTISLDDLRTLELAIRDEFNLDLNYNNTDVIDCDGFTLTKYPFNSENKRLDEVLKIHSAWRELYKLIHELEEIKGTAYAQIAVKLYFPRVFNPTQETAE